MVIARFDKGIDILVAIAADQALVRIKVITNGRITPKRYSNLNAKYCFFILNLSVMAQDVENEAHFKIEARREVDHERSGGLVPWTMIQAYKILNMLQTEGESRSGSSV